MRRTSGALCQQRTLCCEAGLAPFAQPGFDPVEPPHHVHDERGVAAGAGLERVGEAAPDMREAGDKFRLGMQPRVGFVDLVGVTLHVPAELPAEAFGEFGTAAAHAPVVEHAAARAAHLPQVADP